MKPPPTRSTAAFPADIISYVVCLYHVFSLSLWEAELRPAERGIVVSYETIGR